MRLAARARLSTLGPKDKYLAVTKPHYDNIRANITYSRLDARGRVQLAAELPSSTPPAAGPHRPWSTTPRPVDDLANQPRQVRQSELEPFLESIPAYRYVHG